MTEPRDTKQNREPDKESARNDRRREKADERKAPAPQGGKGTPSQAEGERTGDE
jgi:hypothetical protein